MKGKSTRLLITLVLGFGLPLALLGLLGSNASQVTRAQSGTGVICVATTGSDTPGCGSETSPCRTVQYAVDQALPGEEIQVATGTYTDIHQRAGITQVVYISKTITIQGGYTTTNWTTPDPSANSTTLDAQGQGRVFYVIGPVSPTIEGLHITGGNATGLRDTPWPWGFGVGGGINIITATTTLSGCHIHSNTAQDAGGGAFLWHSAATLSDNIIQDNKVQAGNGGGLRLEQSSATLSGNTILSNTAEAGGGVSMFLSDVTLNNNTIQDNRAIYGGGMSLLYTVATLSKNTVSSNTALADGGGVSLSSSTTKLSSNAIFSNTAQFNGGGVHSVHGDAVLSGNLIQGNTVSGVSGAKGGGLYVFYSKATLINNIILGNRISGIHSGGGGVYLEGWWRPALLSRNLICGNMAQGRGGGLFLFANAATVSGNFILSNVAEEGGGVVLMTDSNATLVNNVVANNQAHTAGSGVYVAGSKPRFLHTTIARNTDGKGSGVYVTTDGFLHYSTVSLTNTIIAGHHNVGITVTTGSTATLEATLWYDNGSHTGGGGTIVTGTVNVYDDPVFVDSSAWDYHLTAGSAAIDEGVNAGVNEDIDSDLRPIGVGYDIGADEYAVHAYLPIVLSNYGP